MEARRLEDPAAYAEQVLPFLLRAPARHNLYLGILDTLQRHPATYPAFHLWAVEDGGEVIAAAMQTAPHNLVLAEPARPDAIETLVTAITDAGVRPPGVVGGIAEAQAFADAWRARHGGDHHTINRQGIYELTAIRAHGSADGAPRLATDEDLPLLIAWHRDFLAEAVPHHIGDDDAMRRRLTGVVADGGFWLWESAGRRVDDGRQPRAARRRADRPGLHAARAARTRIRHRVGRPRERARPHARPHALLPAHRPGEPDVERDLSADRLRVGLRGNGDQVRAG